MADKCQMHDGAGSDAQRRHLLCRDVSSLADKLSSDLVRATISVGANQTLQQKSSNVGEWVGAVRFRYFPVLGEQPQTVWIVAMLIFRVELDLRFVRR
jgi:hypothetical protein